MSMVCSHLQKFKDVPKRLKKGSSLLQSLTFPLKHVHTSKRPQGFREAERKPEDIKKKSPPITGPKMKTVLDASPFFPM